MASSEAEVEAAAADGCLPWAMASSEAAAANGCLPWARRSIRFDAEPELAKSGPERIGADVSSEVETRRLPRGQLLAACEVETCEAGGGDGGDAAEDGDARSRGRGVGHSASVFAAGRTLLARAVVQA